MAKGLVSRTRGKCGGAYCVRGSRITVRCLQAVGRRVREAGGDYEAEVALVRKLYPQLTFHEIDAALTFRRK